ncbi:LLM class oxidoreductase [Nonomuraea cypriaca]|uniref:hypothetical protein n=1 Tax=Nonomuraea cypriaca TaxID=1187855 RepID=UPI001A9C9C2E|nr:hypothetical protein [Nonomuraea cypriaca]
MDAVETVNPAPKGALRRIPAAYGPKMLELARDRAAGAQTYHVNVAHTAQARDILGLDAFLAVEHPVLFESDPGKARAIARAGRRSRDASPWPGGAAVSSRLSHPWRRTPVLTDLVVAYIFIQSQLSIRC